MSAFVFGKRGPVRGIFIPRFAKILTFAIFAALLSSPALAQTLTSITVTQICNCKPNSNMGVGTSGQFTATGNYSDGTTQYLTQQVTWSSENTAIMTITPTMGWATAIAPGTTNLDATISGITGKISVTVVSTNLIGVGITPINPTLQTGKTQQFSAIAQYGDAAISNVTSAATWSSSNTAVATISPTGLVTNVAAGTTTITANYSVGKGSTLLTVTTTAPPSLGQWSAPESFGTIAIHTNVLNSGKVLMWGYPSGRNGGPSPARLLDPATDTWTDVTLPWPIDIFCASQTFLRNGTLLVDGGLDDTFAGSAADSGIWNSTFFDPKTNTWSTGPLMTWSRWYPTTVEEPNGTILAMSGTDNNAQTIQTVMESYSPQTNTWTQLPASANIPRPIDLYPLMAVLGNGNLFYAAPRQDSQQFNPTTNTWSFVANQNFGVRDHAAIVQFGQQVMVVAGAANDTNGGAGPTNTTETINFASSTPAWSYSAPLNIARFNHNLIYLADGSLLAVGGGQSGHYGSPVFQPEQYSFTTQKWTLMAAQLGIRAYHSTAVLLPDGRVLSAGSDSGTPWETTYEIYSPPYWFAGARPTITSVGPVVHYSKTFTIKTPDATNIKTVALLRPGTTTHAMHFDDHVYISLKFTAVAGQLTVTAPLSANAAVPGYYMLVIVNKTGIPSVMPFIQVSN